MSIRRQDVDPETWAKLAAAGPSEPPPATPKRSKYGNRKTVVGGITFASKREAGRYTELSLMFRAGDITEFRLQPEFLLYVRDVLVCRYVADFSYRRGGELVVEDVKSPATRRNRAYRIKAKLMLAVLGIEIREV